MVALAPLAALLLPLSLVRPLPAVSMTRMRAPLTMCTPASSEAAFGASDPPKQEEKRGLPGTDPFYGSKAKPAGTIAGLARWDPQAWVIPAIWNTPAFRAASIATALALAAAGSRQLGARMAIFAHLISFGSLFGSMIYTTFFAGITMFKNLPRQTFGRLQSKLFPIYFKLHAASLCVMLGTLRAVASGGSLTRPVYACGSALLFTLLNLFYLEPQSTKVMFTRYDLENEGKQESDEYKVAAKKFGPLHGMSSLANLGALIGVIAHSWWLGGAFM